MCCAITSPPATSLPCPPHSHPPPRRLVVPLYQSLLIVITIVAGGIFYHEFAGLPTLHALGFSGGLLLCTTGLILLANAAGDGAAAPSELPEPLDEAPRERRASIARDPRLRVVSMSGYVSAALADLPAVSEVRGGSRWLSDAQSIGRARAETLPLRKDSRAGSAPSPKPHRHRPHSIA